MIRIDQECQPAVENLVGPGAANAPRFKSLDNGPLGPLNTAPINTTPVAPPVPLETTPIEPSPLGSP